MAPGAPRVPQTCRPPPGLTGDRTVQPGDTVLSRDVPRNSHWSPFPGVLAQGRWHFGCSPRTHGQEPRSTSSGHSAGSRLCSLHLSFLAFCPTPFFSQGSTNNAMAGEEPCSPSLVGHWQNPQGALPTSWRQRRKKTARRVGLGAGDSFPWE